MQPAIASQAIVRLSAAIAEIQPLPEPSPWLLVISGVALVALGLRRRSY